MSRKAKQRIDEPERLTTIADLVLATGYREQDIKRLIEQGRIPPPHHDDETGQFGWYWWEVFIYTIAPKTLLKLSRNADR